MKTTSNVHKGAMSFAQPYDPYSTDREIIWLSQPYDPDNIEDNHAGADDIIDNEFRKSEYVGEVGSPEREAYEAELKAAVFSSKLKELRKSKRMTQEELGEILNMNKSQISRMEKSVANVNMVTMLRVISVLDAQLALLV